MNTEQTYYKDEILVKRFGWNMVLYDFYKVVKVSPVSIWIRKLDKISLEPSSFTPVVEPSIYFDENSKVECKRIKSFWMSKYDPKTEYREDHLD